MKKFSELEYSRPDIEKMKNELESYFMSLENSKDAEEQLGIIKKVNDVRRDYETMQTICNVNYTINTSDEFYSKEHDYLNEVKPIFQECIFRYYTILNSSRFKKELSEKLGNHLFNNIEMVIKTFSPIIMDDLREENKLSTEYVKLLASAKIQFEGEERNLTGMAPFMSSPDRTTRKKANEAKWNFFKDHDEEFDEIYDKLVKCRDKMAKKLGFKNFVEMGYLRMRRNEYTPQMVASFRSEVLNHIVPVTMKLKERQKARLEMNDLMYYDNSLSFKTGNPTPKGEPGWIMQNARKMYKELSEETDVFMSHMIDNELMDLYNRKNKAMGGYCTFIPNYKSPFIFSNMNGTADDIRVLTHEAGHAFQAYSSRNIEVPEYIVPTLEAAEIHSMSMEYITWPWMDLFFEEDTEKFKYSHLEKSLLFLPYGCAVDEFQHFVYENPDVTPKERSLKYREIEKKYMPYINYDDNEYLDKGNIWKQQAHIYKSPFYYIDYCLAEICAYQFWIKTNENREKAWNSYVELCKAGGSKPYLQLVELAGLDSPFNKGTISKTVNHISGWLSSIEDSKL